MTLDMYDAHWKVGTLEEKSSDGRIAPLRSWRGTRWRFIWRRTTRSTITRKIRANLNIGMVASVRLKKWSPRRGASKRMTDLALVALVVALVWPPVVVFTIEMLRTITEF